MSKLKPCFDGKRHQWVFVKNTIVTRRIGTGYDISKKGFYRCKNCTESKLGQPQRENDHD